MSRQAEDRKDQMAKMQNYLDEKLPEFKRELALSLTENKMDLQAVIQPVGRPTVQLVDLEAKQKKHFWQKQPSSKSKLDAMIIRINFIKDKYNIDLAAQITPEGAQLMPYVKDPAKLSNLIVPKSIITPK